MTSGSSQGLFVIVAVVIFGIFITISYLLFRDKLQTGLASIFTDSILNTTGNIQGNTNILNMELLKSRRTLLPELNEIFEVNSNSVLMASDNLAVSSQRFGIKYGDYSTFKSKTTYVLKFKMKDLENVLTIGGYEDNVGKTNYVKINGKTLADKYDITNTWTTSYNLQGIPKIDDGYNVEYSFTTLDLTTFKETKAETTALFIMPNRLINQKFKVLITDFELYEVN